MTTVNQSASSVRLEVFSNPPDKSANEAELVSRAATFFGHDEATHNGFKHDATEPDGSLRTYTIFYDKV